MSPSFQRDRPRSPTGLPPISNIPDQALPFEGRDGQIADLLELFERYGHVLLHNQHQWPYDPGKSQMAIAYCRRYTLRYDVAWWFSCEGESDEESLRRLIGEEYRQLREVCDRNLGSQPEYRPDKRWLFVYDGVSNPDRIFEHFVPGTGHRLITSRAVGETWGKNRLELGGLTPREAAGLLRNQAQNLSSYEADQLASLIDGHPGQLLAAAGFAREFGFDACIKALTQVHEGGRAAPLTPASAGDLTAAPAGIAAQIPSARSETRRPLGAEDKRTLIEALMNSPVGRTRESYEVWLDSIRIAVRPLELEGVSDAGLMQTRMISVVNCALRQSTPVVMRAIADALEEHGGEDTGVVRRLVDNAVRVWDDH